MTGWLVMTARPAPPYRWAFMLLLDGGRPSRALGWVSLLAPARYPGRRRGRALGRWTPAAGPGRVGRRCWLRASGVGPWHGSADPGRGGKEKHPAALKGPLLPHKPGTTGPGYRRDGNTCGPARLSRYSRRSASPCFPLLAEVVIGVPWRLRHPRRLTVLAIARGSPDVVCQCPPGRPGPCSGAGRGWRAAQPWSQPDR